MRGTRSGMVWTSSRQLLAVWWQQSSAQMETRLAKQRWSTGLHWDRSRIISTMPKIITMTIIYMEHSGISDTEIRNKTFSFIFTIQQQSPSCTLSSSNTLHCRRWCADVSLHILWNGRLFIRIHVVNWKTTQEFYVDGQPHCAARSIEAGTETGVHISAGVTKATAWLHNFTKLYFFTCSWSWHTVFTCSFSLIFIN